MIKQMLTLMALFLPLLTWGQEQASSPAGTLQRATADTISASLLVVDPSADVFSVHGHCALRLRCMALQKDSCYRFEPSDESRGIAHFFSGTAKGIITAEGFGDFVAACREKHLSVTEYPLNLNAREARNLWQTVNAELHDDEARPHGYMHTQCATICVHLVNRALGTCIKYNDLPAELRGTFRDVLLQASDRHPWSVFFWQTVMGPEGDHGEPLVHKLTPTWLPVAWQRATIGSEQRRLLTEEGKKIVAFQETRACPFWIKPVTVFALLLFLTAITTFSQCYKGWRKLPLVTDVFLLALHTTVGLLLTYLVLFPVQEGTQWNWYLLAFNPLPLLAWLLWPAGRRWTVRVFMGVLLVFIALTPFVPQLDLAHALLVASLLPRLAVRGMRNEK